MSGPTDGTTGTGTGVARAGRANAGALLVAFPTALVLVAEAAWIAVVAAVLQAFALRPPAVGFWWFLAASALGLVAARTLSPRAGDRWPTVAAALAIAVGASTWIASGEVRSILALQGIDGVGEAIGANIGGWLASVAFVRGIAHSRLPVDPHRVGNLLGLAIPGLAMAALVGGMVGEPFRSGFLAEAQAEVLLFVVAGILALALSRLGLVAKGAAVDWRRNPAWLGLLVVLLLATALLAIVVSLFAGPIIVMAVGALFTPLLIVGFFVGFDRRSFMILLLSVLGTAAVASLLQLFAAQNPSPPPAVPDVLVPVEPAAGAATPVTLGVLGIVIAVAVIALLLLARLWLRRPRDEDPAVPETREIDRGDRGAERRRPRRALGLRRRPSPHDAASAYRALLEDLEREPALRRLPAETPAEHAARLRTSGHGDLALDLLAADYGLVQFGGVALTDREERRAIARARVLRGRLRVTPGLPLSRR